MTSLVIPFLLVLLTIAEGSVWNGSVTISIADSSWTGGYCTHFIITNNGTQTSSSWTVTLTSSSGAQLNFWSCDWKSNWNGWTLTSLRYYSQCKITPCFRF